MEPAIEEYVSSQDSGPEIVPYVSSQDSGPEIMEYVSSQEQVGSPSKRPYTFRQRSKSSKPPAMRRQLLLSLGKVKELLSKGKCGCVDNCYGKLCIADVYHLRQSLWHQRKASESDTLIYSMIRDYTVLGSDGKQVFVPRINGITTCRAAWYQVLGIGRSKFYDMKKEVDRFMFVRGHRRSGGGLSREKRGTSYTRAVFRRYFSAHGQVQPHRVIKVAGSKFGRTIVLLPANLTVKDVYTNVKIDVESKGFVPVQLSTFYRLWQKEFPWVQIPAKSRMAKCSTCSELDMAIKVTPNGREADRILRRKDRHLQQVAAHRAVYWDNRAAALADVDESLCVILDGFNQRTTVVPHLMEVSKRTAQQYMKTHLCGVIVHGRYFFCDVWIDAFHRHDSNQVVTSLMHALVRVHEEYGKLPSRLYLQADNCSRENKNRYIFALCATLVEMGMFSEVNVGFMMVGHTHDDIDQAFSVLSRELKSHDTYTLDHLIERVSCLHNARPRERIEVRHLKYMWDWRGFVGPYLQQGNDQLVGHTHPYLFRFFKNGLGQAVMQFKQYCTDEVWEPITPYQMLRNVDGETVANLLSRGVKPGMAAITPPNMDEIKALRNYRDFRIEMAQKYPSGAVEDNRVADGLDQLIEHLLSPHTNEELEAAAQHMCFVPMLGSTGNQPGLMQQVEDPVVDEDEDDDELFPRQYCGAKKDQPSVQEDAYDPWKDLEVGDFVALRSDEDDDRACIHFWVAKVGEVDADTFAPIWYHPKPQRHLNVDDTNWKVQHYDRCLDRIWVPTMLTDDVKQSKSSAFVSWKVTDRKTAGLVRFCGTMVEKQMKVPRAMLHHFKTFLEMKAAEHSSSVDV